MVLKITYHVCRELVMMIISRLN